VGVDIEPFGASVDRYRDVTLGLGDVELDAAFGITENAAETGYVPILLVPASTYAAFPCADVHDPAIGAGVAGGHPLEGPARVERHTLG
jgi:hypothetical protein